MPEKRYDKDCWSCNSKGTMVAKGSYYQCSECGATWNEMLTLGSSIGVAIDSRGAGKTSSFHPVKQRGKVLPPLSDRSKKARRKASQSGQPIY